jgi:tRNA-modifying protein YgfZ
MSSATDSRYRSPLLAVPGAVEAEGLDAGVAWHYGDPVKEQRALVAGQAVTDLSHRGLLRVTGPDRLTWLNSVTTQLLTDMAPGDSRETLVLSPHGHVEHAVQLVDDGEACWLSVEPQTVAALAQWLRSMQFMQRVQVDDVSDEWAQLGMCAEPPGLVVPDGAPPSWVDPWPRPGVDTRCYTSLPEDEHPGLARPWRQVWVPRARLTEVVAQVRPAGSWAAEALRVAAWRPRLGAETDHRTIPHELDWLRTAVHLNKGCYRGQETVARVVNLGRPPRRLVMLHLDGSEHTLPPSGSAVQSVANGGAGGRDVGRVTTSARHHELGPIALAVVKRSLPATDELQVDGLAAAQEIIVTP